MKPLRRLLACGLLLAAPSAWSAISCSLTSNPSPIRMIYNWWFTGATLSGTINLACTRDPSSNDPRRPDFWIGMGQPAAGRTVTGDTGGTINYDLYHNTTNSGTWTNTGAAVAPGSGTTGPVLDTGPDFGGGQGSSLTRSYAFYVRVAPFQNPIPAAGVYTDTLPFEVRLNGPTGTPITGGALTVIISVPKSCRFSTAPSAIDINYPAFSPVAVNGSSNFGITCTQGTNYTIGLDQPTSVVPGVELAYSLSLNAGTAPIAGTAVEQGYTVNISVPPGQAGRCNTAVCTGTDTRTITVSY